MSANYSACFQCFLSHCRTIKDTCIMPSQLAVWSHLESSILIIINFRHSSVSAMVSDPSILSRIWYSTSQQDLHQFNYKCKLLLAQTLKHYNHEVFLLHFVYYNGNSAILHMVSTRAPENERDQDSLYM